jgi:DNA ligase (NAD+)
MNASQFLKDLKKLKKEDLLEIKGIGEILADNFLEFLESPRYTSLIKDLEDLEAKNEGLDLDLKTFLKKPKTAISGMKFVITGSFDIPRDQIKKQLEELGAKATSSVSSHTDFILAGEKPGSKLSKAQELGLKVFTSLEDLYKEMGLPT